MFFTQYMHIYGEFLYIYIYIYIYIYGDCIHANCFAVHAYGTVLAPTVRRHQCDHNMA